MIFNLSCYPHMPIGKMWIYRLLFVCVCVFVRIRISPPRIKLAASNFARCFISVQGREFPVLGNFSPPEAQTRTNRVWTHGRPRRRTYLFLSFLEIKVSKLQLHSSSFSQDLGLGFKTLAPKSRSRFQVFKKRFDNNSGFF